MQEQGEGAGVIRSLKKEPWKAESEGMHRDQLFNCAAKINTLHHYITPLKAGLKSQSPGRSKSTGMFTETSEQEKATLPQVPVTGPIQYFDGGNREIWSAVSQPQHPISVQKVSMGTNDKGLMTTTCPYWI